MKTTLSIITVIVLFLTANKAMAQMDKTILSPPDSVSVTTNDGVTIKVNYSKPSLRGRKFGVDLAKFGEVWRTGANAITVIEFDKNVLVAGKALPRGKYGLWTIPGEDETTVIFSKKWKGWGVNYSDQEDQLRVNVKNIKGNPSVEQFTISVEPSGQINLAWDEYIIPIAVKAGR